MEPARRYELKLEQLSKAVRGFVVSLNLAVSEYNEDLKDAVENGQIQKFEYCVELIWKTIKLYLRVYHQIDARSPKEAISSLLDIKKINELTYESLHNMIKDRNTLSHVYNEEDFKTVHKKLPAYRETMITVLDAIKVK